MPHQPLGENFHLVGLTQAFNPYTQGTPPPPPVVQNVVNLDIDVDDVVEIGRTSKKRSWTHDEEVRLVNTYNNIAFFLL